MRRDSWNHRWRWIGRQRATIDQHPSTRCPCTQRPHRAAQAASLARPACALVQTHDVSVPARGTKTACVRMAEDLNWRERQQLRAKHMLQPASGRSHAGSDSGSSASGLGGGSLPLTDAESKGCGWTCLKRERALWRTLHRAGCLGSAASSTGSAESSAADAGALSHAHGKRQGGLP